MSKENAGAGTPHQSTAQLGQILHAALAHHQAGRLGEAEALYRQVLEAQPKHPDALHLLGMLAHQSGKNDAAVDLIQQAILVAPDNFQFHNNLGTVCLALRRFEQAAVAFRRALALHPDYAEAHNNLGNALYELGELEPAIHSYRKAISCKRDYFEAYSNLGTILNELGKYEEAISIYRQALAINPSFAGAHYNMGIALNTLGKPEEAIDCYRTAIGLNPDFAEAYTNLGLALKTLGKLSESMAYHEKAIALRPNYAEAYNNLGNALSTLGRLDEAIEIYHHALEIRPDLPEANSSLFFTLDLSTKVDTAMLQAERKRWADIHAAPLAALQRPHGNVPEPSRRLRIGYVSADFKRHSAASVFGAMLLHYDRARFEVYAYSNVKKEDQYTDLFRQNVTHWRSILGISDEAVAERIRTDGIDILIDLSGHSSGNRLAVFARKPAPIQVTAWGYPTGTGMAAMDALLADPVVIPPEERSLYAEGVRYLPCLVSYFSPETFPDVGPLPATSAKEITFGSFNRLAKVSREALDVWCKVLLAVPNSRMLLKSGELDEPATRERVIRHFTDAGIAPERIRTLGWTTWAGQLEAFNQIDISLDPFPHGGGVTTLEGIMMGVPVVTLRWPTFAGRLSASIMTALGLTDWIAETPEQYLDIAVRKAADITSLAQLRGNLRADMNNSVIGNNPLYVRKVEEEYGKLWTEWCTRTQPKVSIANEVSPSPKPNVPSLLQKALKHHNEGRLPEAEELYRQILQFQPNHPDTLHLMGMIAHHGGRDDDAIELIKRAIQATPKNHQFHNNLGTVYLAQGKQELAAKSFSRAIATHPNFAEAHNNLGNALYDLGKLPEAAASYRKAIACKPDYFEAHNNLGTTLMKLGKADESIASYRQALAINPAFAGAHYNLGIMLNEQGMHEEAIASFRAAISLKPDFAEAYSNLGAALNDLGKQEEAVAFLEKSLALNPSNADACNNLGVAFNNLDKPEEAETYFKRALSLKPEHANAYYNLGNYYRVHRRHNEAIACYQQALKFRPNLSEAYNNLGTIASKLGNLDEALAYYRQSLALLPNQAEVHNNLGIALKDQGKYDEALESCRHALEVRPDFADAHISMGVVLNLMRQPEEAIRHFRLALEIAPDSALGYNNLGLILSSRQCNGEAIAAYRKALEIDPDFSDAYSNLLFTLDLATDIDIPALQAERRHWAEAHALPLMASWKPHANSPEPGRRLCVGYVSADFRRHSAASVFATMLLNFDPARFEVFAYSNTLSEDQYTQLFRDHVSHWRKIVGLSDEAVADLIRADQIDILVDLSGHSGGNRLLAFARKPAPVQVTAWGYPTGTGMRAMDALFADAVVIPPEERQFYAESVRYLPSLVSFFSSSDFPAVAGLPALASGAVTFGSFNRLDKVSPEAFALWARVLLAVPGSRMLLKSGEFDDPATCARVLGYFTSAGVAPERILMRGRTPWIEHVAAFAEVDIALDPFPHGGGVTALEGIMMGVPVVTLRWPTFAGRLSASILTTLALTDWIAESPEQYLDIAVRMAADIPALARLRANLRTTLANSPIGNTQAYARLVENEYRVLWNEWCSQQGISEASNPATTEYRDDIAVALDAAMAHHQAGRLLEAEAIYQDILQIDPGNSDALYLLGMLAHQAGQSDIAIDLIRHAILAAPSNSRFHDSLGTIYKSMGKLDEAIDSYHQAIALNPDSADAYYNLGIAYWFRSDSDAAITAYRRALELRPDFVDAYNNLGAALKKQGDIAGAVECYRQALAHRPDFASAHNNLGILLKGQGNFDEAMACYQQAIALNPDYAEAYNNLGNALREMSRFDEAISACEQAIRIRPDYPEAYCSLGNIHKDQGMLDEAIRCYRHAIDLKPDYARAHHNMGATFLDLRNYNAALECFNRTIALSPNSADAYSSLGNALCGLNRQQEGIACYRKALEIDPNFSDAQTNLIFTLDLATDIDIPALQAERRHWAEAHALPLMASWRPHANSPEPGRRLRVGYVSADFRRHSAASVFATMLLNFDPTRFEVFAYSNTLSEDQYTQLFRDHVSHWRKIVGLSDEAVADLVRADQIDILVDLSGHSGGNRLLAFARKPAPVQVTAWGYPTGTGMRAMDALFADAVVIPPEERQFYAESVRYLPSLVSFFSSSDFPAVAGLPALASGAVTFGSFNRLDKVSPEAFALWARVLLAVPGSRMLLKSGEFDDPATCARVLGYFTSAGVAPERILMRGRTPWVEHVAAFAEVDIALDPFPHGGGVTALEGIMMGVPVVTLRWPTFAGRLSASILTTLALTDWIAESPEQYLDIAVRMAADIPALARLRANLRTTLANSPIGNTQAYARLVENEYRVLWSEWCSLQPSVH